MLDFKNVRQDFPFLNHKINNHKIIFFDTASSSQKPQIVIETVKNCYAERYSNIHRGTYLLSQNISNEYENVRFIIKKFINAELEREIIFTKSTTESLNFISHSLLDNYLNNNDEIILTEMEHHSNIIPWHLIKKFKKIKIHYIKVDKSGLLNLSSLTNMLNKNTKLISISHCSNVIGNINPIKSIIKIIRNRCANIAIVIDGAQSILHKNINVVDLDCDFFVFSSHKLYGPTGVGVLYAKKIWHNLMSPYQGGGGMIKKISLKDNVILYADSPQKFEAGTPNIVGVIGLGSAINYLKKLNFYNIMKYEKFLCDYFMNKVSLIPKMKLIGKNLPNKIGIFTFKIDGIHSQDIGSYLNLYGICVRTGHHCAQPLLETLGYSSTIRVSLGIYNITSEIDKFFTVLEKAIKILDSKI